MPSADAAADTGLSPDGAGDYRGRSPVTVVFDVIGTLVSLERLRPVLVDQGADANILELWFAEALRDYFSISHSGAYVPFGEVLKGGLARHPVLNRDAVMTCFATLDPMPEADAACGILARAGCKILALTNGSSELTNSLLINGGLRHYFDRVLSCDSIRVSKPHPRVYALAVEAADGEAWMVASHAWDTAGAGRAGLKTVLVYPDAAQIPGVFPAPDVVAPDLVAAANAILAVTEPKTD